MSIRNKKTIKLDDKVSVTVWEIGPTELCNISEYMAKFADSGQLSFVVDILADKRVDLINKFSSLIEVHGCDFEDIGYGCLIKIYDAFVEVNAAFLEGVPKMLQKLGLVINPAMIGAMLDETSIERAADSLIGGIQGAGTTAGDFS